MSRSPRTRRSGTTRRVAMIEHQPADAESAAGASAAAGGSETAGQAAGKTHPAEEAAMHGENTSPENILGKKAGRSRFHLSASGICANKRFCTCGSLLLAGIIGGITAVVAVTALQKMGVLAPSVIQSKPAETVSASRLEDEVAGLKKQLAAMAEAAQKAIALGQQGQDVLVEAKQNATRAAAAAAIVTDAEKKARSALAAVGRIRDELAASHPDEAAVINLRNMVMQRMAELETGLKALDHLKQDMAATQSATQDQQSRLEMLKKTVESRIDQERHAASGLTLLVATHALKAAVDRGGPYARELLNFEAVAPADFSSDLLQRYADKGLPSAAELSGRFTAVADRIARTENSIPADAGIAGKLWAGVRALVTARPVGHVEGNRPGAIAARMEVAIAAGDYPRAISEWQALPDRAKAVSDDYMTMLRARDAVDSLLLRFMAAAFLPAGRQLPGGSAGGSE